MRKNPRKLVVRFEESPNLGPSKHLWPVVSFAHLECGHMLELGVGTDYRPKRMACYEAGFNPKGPMTKADKMAGFL